MVDATVLGRCFELCPDALGAVVLKSTTIHPRSGYPEPKVSRFGGGYLVASGNCNPGIDRMTVEVRRFKERFDGQVLFGSIVNDPDHPQTELAAEFCYLAVEYAKAGVDGLELNLSCPHLDPAEKEHTIVPGQNPELVGQLIRAVKSSLGEAGFGGCAVIPKLTGWNCNPAEVSRSAERAGADAVIISNLFPGTGYHTGIGNSPGGHSTGLEIGDYLVAHGKGGYSGKAMHSAVLLLIENLRKHIGIPIIATGGCATDLDSLVQTFMAGATAVETVTPFYFRSLEETDVLLGLNGLVEQLEDYLEQHSLVTPGALYEFRTKAVPVAGIAQRN